MMVLQDIPQTHSKTILMKGEESEILHLKGIRAWLDILSISSGCWQKSLDWTPKLRWMVVSQNHIGYVSKCFIYLQQTNSTVFAILSNITWSPLLDKYFQNQFIWLCYLFFSWSAVITVNASWRINNMPKYVNFGNNCARDWLLTSRCNESSTLF